MADQVFPTKGNLLNVKKSLFLAKVGYELLDRKRNVLIRELMMMVDAAKALRNSISDTYKEAYAALQRANITMGLISRTAESMPVEKSVSVTYRSVMGCELPKVSVKSSSHYQSYGFENTDGNVDLAYICFERVKQMTAMLAEVDNSVFRLANAIKKTQTRANALKNIVIPRYETTVKFIENSLEEKEREEFSRMKVIKEQNKRRKLKARQIQTVPFEAPDLSRFGISLDNQG
ncbi:MAG: V-type ATP synthase subunit D [Huintestinicola sp.]